MRGNYKALILTILAFGSITFAQFIAAVAADSEALLIDSVSMLVDTLTYVVNLCAASYHKDVIELIAAGISLVVLLGASIWGITEACNELLHPTSGRDDLSPDIVLAFGLWGIAFDCLSFWGFYKWGRRDLLSTSNHSLESYTEFERKLDNDNSCDANASAKTHPMSGGSSMNMRSAFLHVGADFLRSIVIVGEGLAVKFEGAQGRQTDSIAALIVSVTILLSAVGAIVPWLLQLTTWRKRCAAEASKADLRVMAQEMVRDKGEPAPLPIGIRTGEDAQGGNSSRI